MMHTYLTQMNDVIHPTKMKEMHLSPAGSSPGCYGRHMCDSICPAEVCCGAPSQCVGRKAEERTVADVPHLTRLANEGKR